MQEVRSWNLALSLAVLAWAVAVEAGECAEVEQVLARATDLVSEQVIPVAGQVFYHQGRAYAALGQNAKSVDAFSKSADLDPPGHYGRLSQAQVTIK